MNKPRNLNVKEFYDAACSDMNDGAIFNSKATTRFFKDGSVTFQLWNGDIYTLKLQKHFTRAKPRSLKTGRAVSEKWFAKQYPEFRNDT